LTSEAEAESNLATMLSAGSTEAFSFSGFVTPGGSFERSASGERRKASITAEELRRTEKEGVQELRAGREVNKSVSDSSRFTNLGLRDLLLANQLSHAKRHVQSAYVRE